MPPRRSRPPAASGDRADRPPPVTLNPPIPAASRHSGSAHGAEPSTDDRRIQGNVDRPMPSRDVASNRQASYRYHLLEKWEVGLVLLGTEVKALREGKAQIKDGYASV